MSQLFTNTASLQILLDMANTLPEGGGELPELSSPANASEVFLGKQYIDSNGLAKTGTFTLQNEISEQDNLISQIQSALGGKASSNEMLIISKTSDSYINDVTLILQ